MTEAILEKMDDLYSRIIIPEKILLSEKTPYQQMEIIKTRNGKALVLDGSLQLHTYDEFIYHEMLVHFPLIHHPRPERVLVLGGGDGFLLRETLKYQSVKEVTLVDIDENVVDACKEHFAQENCNSFDDPRLDLIIDDALHYADISSKRFDVIIMDLVEPYGEGAKLYSKEGIGKFTRLLKKDGIFATHCEDADGKNDVGLKVFALLSKMFSHSKLGLSYIRSFDGLWAFAVLSNQELRKVNQETAGLSLRYFQPEKTDCYSNLPPYLKDKLEDYIKNGFDAIVEEPVEMKMIKLPENLEKLLKE